MPSEINRLVGLALELVSILVENSEPSISVEELKTILGENPQLPEFYRRTEGVVSSTSTPGKSHIATPKGESTEKYCLDCMSKHLGTAKILIREALQRAVKGEDPQAILEKVRGAYEELMGAEDDSQSLSDPRIQELNKMTRELRKWAFNSGVLVEPDKELISQFAEKINQLNDEVYNELSARKQRLYEFLTKAKERLEKLQKELEEQKETGISSTR
jgi:DNA repair exonuclease SbcCD ATPase subunit